MSDDDCPTVPRATPPPSPSAATASPLDSEAGKVGYGSPPRASRWKPGQSGNPRGRRKGARGFKAAAAAMLNEPVQLQVKGKLIRRTTREAMYLKLKEQGFKGNMRALEKMIEFDRMIEEIEEAKAYNANRDRISEEDLALIEAAVQRLAPSGGEDAP